MNFLKRQIRFLHIHFTVLGLTLFALHYFGIAERYLLFMSGPAIYLASYVKQALLRFIELPTDQNTLELILLLPAHIIYYGLIGFLLKQVFTEKGFIKILTLLILAGFLGFIHFVSGNALNLYLTPLDFVPSLNAV